MQTMIIHTLPEKFSDKVQHKQLTYSFCYFYYLFPFHTQHELNSLWIKVTLIYTCWYQQINRDLSIMTTCCQSFVNLTIIQLLTCKYVILMLLQCFTQDIIKGKWICLVNTCLQCSLESVFKGVWKFAKMRTISRWNLLSVRLITSILKTAKIQNYHLSFTKSPNTSYDYSNLVSQ